MLSPNPYMTLSTALGFSAADINANRLGVHTPYQRGMLVNQRLRALSAPAILMLMLIVAGYALQVEFIFAAFIAACLITIMVATWQRFQDDLESPVEVVVGQWAQRALPWGRHAAITTIRSDRRRRIGRVSATSPHEKRDGAGSVDTARLPPAPLRR